MKIPFTTEEFLQLFRAYNDAIGFAPLLLIAIAIVVVVVANTGLESRHRIIFLGLALLWLWSGIVYHLMFFSRINPAARFFGAIFIIQGVLLLAAGFAKGRFRFRAPRGVSALFGWLLIAYAVLVYPVLGWLAGHGYPAGPTFGAPCPTTIFFFGMVLWIDGAIPIFVVLWPLVWAAVGTTAALQLGMREDFGLTVAALLVIAEMIRRRYSGSGEPLSR